MALDEGMGLGQGTGLQQQAGLALPPEMARQRAMQLAAQSEQARKSRTSQGSNALGVGMGALGAIVGAFAGNPMLGYTVGSAAGKGVGSLVGNDAKGAADNFVSAVTGGTDLAKMFKKKNAAAPAGSSQEVTAPTDSPLGPELGTMTQE